MTPLTEAHTEMRLFVEVVERRAATLKGVRGDAGRWEDHRTEMLGDLWKALDGIEHKLGLRLVVALHPELQAIAEHLLSTRPSAMRSLPQ